MPEIDFTPIAESAKALQMTACEVQHVEASRETRRTDQTYSLGGFAEYSGELPEFLPWLTAVQWTGVGRLTPWGNGCRRITPSSHPSGLIASNDRA